MDANLGHPRGRAVGKAAKSGGFSAAVHHLERGGLAPVAPVAAADQFFDQVHAAIVGNLEWNAPALKGAGEGISPNDFEVFHATAPDAARNLELQVQFKASMGAKAASVYPNRHIAA